MASHLVEITLAEGVVNGKVTKTLSTVEKTVAKYTRANSLRFKVFGENKFIFIAQGDEPHKVVDDLNTHVGGLVNVKTIPIRPYETFAQHVLGVDSSLCTVNAEGFQNPQKIIFVHAKVDCPGIGMEEFLKIWKEEATAALSARAQGQLDIRLFKTIATRSVYLFFNVPSAEVIDAAVHTLPLAMNPITASSFQFPTVREVKLF